MNKMDGKLIERILVKRLKQQMPPDKGMILTGSLTTANIAFTSKDLFSKSATTILNATAGVGAIPPGNFVFGSFNGLLGKVKQPSSLPQQPEEQNARLKKDGFGNYYIDYYEDMAQRDRDEIANVLDRTLPNICFMGMNRRDIKTKSIDEKISILEALRDTFNNFDNRTSDWRWEIDSKTTYQAMLERAYYLKKFGEWIEMMIGLKPLGWKIHGICLELPDRRMVKI